MADEHDSNSVDVDVGDAVTVVYESRQVGSERTRSGEVTDIPTPGDDGGAAVFAFDPDGKGVMTDVDVVYETVHTNGANGYRKIGRLLDITIH